MGIINCEKHASSTHFNLIFTRFNDDKVVV